MDRSGVIYDKIVLYCIFKQMCLCCITFRTFLFDDQYSRENKSYLTRIFGPFSNHGHTKNVFKREFFNNNIIF